MTDNISNTLDELNIVLPLITAPAASYVPFVRSGNLIIISGQLPTVDGELQYIGKVGDKYTTEEGQRCSRICGINILAQLKAACGGDLSQVKRCVRIGVFVNSIENYSEHSQVANGVSDLMVDVFGKEIGSHARAAVGVGSLPLGVAVEVEAIFEV